MKVIKYNLATVLPDGSEELSAVQMGWNEANEAIAKAEAKDGKYTIEENDMPEAEPSLEDRIMELEAAFAVVMSGRTT